MEYFSNIDLELEYHEFQELIYELVDEKHSYPALLNVGFDKWLYSFIR